MLYLFEEIFIRTGQTCYELGKTPNCVRNLYHMFTHFFNLLKNTYTSSYFHFLFQFKETLFTMVVIIHCTNTLSRYNVNCYQYKKKTKKKFKSCLYFEFFNK